MNLSDLSPKVYAPLLIAILAAAALYLLTGDNSYLVGILVSLIAAGGGIAARPTPTPGVTQRQVAALAAAEADPLPPDRPPEGTRRTDPGGAQESRVH